MPMFQISSSSMAPVSQSNFQSEKQLQHLVETNLETIFNCRFVATEFSTGAQHAGRIDTLALSEDNNPVIIEYKKIESSDLITQSLFYLSWIGDHRGDFEIAAQKKLGADVEVDWSDVRVLCIAPGYKKYDLHAVRVMGANIELWRYRLYDNQTIYFEEIFKQAYPENDLAGDKDPAMVAAGKKGAITRATATYTFEEHLDGKPEKIRSLAHDVRDYILGLDTAIEQNPRKMYIGYKISQNIVCMDVQSQQIRLWLKLKQSEVSDPPSNYRDVSNLGHHGTGDAEFILRSEDDFERTKPYIEMAYRKIGG
nr:hypothetical protein [Anaerolineae bacterium]